MSPGPLPALLARLRARQTVRLLTGGRAPKLLSSAPDADCHEAAEALEAMARALSFYADRTRYRGPNQRLEEPDAWTLAAEFGSYRLDVTRDGGRIARRALGEELS